MPRLALTDDYSRRKKHQTPQNVHIDPHQILGSRRSAPPTQLHCPCLHPASDLIHERQQLLIDDQCFEPRQQQRLVLDSQLYLVQEQPVVRPGTFRLRTSTQCPRNVSMLKFAISGLLVFATASYVGQWAA